MKKRKSLIFILSSSLILGGVSVLASCKEEEHEDVKTDAKIVITGGRNGYTNERIKLNGQVFNSDNKELDWKSSNSLIISVDAEGYVTFLKAGTATITASLKGNSDVKSSPLSLTCYDSTNAVKRLEITSFPKRVSYKTGEQIEFAGLKVMGYLYYDGMKNPNTGVDIALEELSFSIAEGTVLTAGRKTVNLTFAGYEGISFDVDVNDKLVEKVAYIRRDPSHKSYLLEEGYATVDFADMQVYYRTFEDGVAKGSDVKLNPDKYKLSMPTGTKITAEGNYEVIVTPIDSTIVGTTFSISVFAKDTSIQDLVRTLQTAENYQYEIKNNVGTTKDTNGFHYVRTVTKDYYDEIDYQNTSDGAGNIEFSTNKIKSHVGYTTYTEGDKTGIMSYYEDELGSITGGKVVVEGIEGTWRARADAFATLFDKFTVDLLPNKKLNGKFLIIPVEQVEGDDEDGTNTLKKYPLLDQFLSFCGWSGSLITIMTRFTVSLGENNALTMRAIFGDYGYTEMILTNVGTASIRKVDNAIKRGLTPNKNVGADVKGLRDALYNNNYTEYDYSSKAVERYYTTKYIYDVKSADNNYIEIDGKIYHFTIKNNVFTLGAQVETDLTTLPAYINTIAKDGFGYVGEALKAVFGDDEDPKNIVSLDKYAGFSYGNVVTYQSYDLDIVNCLSVYMGNSPMTDYTYRFWAMTTYVDATRDDPTKISEIELWDINSDLRGFVLATRDVGTTSVPAIESYLASLE